MKTYSLDFTPTINMYDAKDMLRVDTMLDIFQTLGTEHAKQIGLNNIGSDNFWIVSHTSLSIKNNKLFNSLSGTTFKNKESRFDAVRNYKLYSNEELIATAASKWLIVNKNTKSIVSIKNVIAESNFSLDEEIYDKNRLKNLKAFEVELDEIASFKVNYLDLDNNMHLNNARYLTHVINALEISDIKELDITYLKEICLYEEVSVFAKRVDNIYYVELRNKTDIKSRIKIEC